MTTTITINKKMGEKVNMDKHFAKIALNLSAYEMWYFAPCE